MSKQTIEESLESIDSHLSYFTNYADVLCNDKEEHKETNKHLENIDWGVGSISDELTSIRESIDNLTDVLKELLQERK